MTLQFTVSLLKVAVIIVSPSEIAVTIPFASTVAIAGFNEVHITLDEGSSEVLS